MVMLSFFSTDMKSISSRATSQRLRGVLQWFFFSSSLADDSVVSSKDITYYLLLSSQVSWIIDNEWDKKGHDTRYECGHRQLPTWEANLSYRSHLRGICSPLHALEPMLMTSKLFIFIVATAGAFASLTSVVTKNELATSIRGLESLEGKSILSRSSMYCPSTGYRTFLVRTKKC